MNALVTGCNGFVGSYLTEYLYKKGQQVFGIDLHGKANYPWIKYRQLDITNLEDVSSFLEKWKIEEIYHLASIANPVYSNSEPYKTTYVNIIGTINFLEKTRQNKDIRIILVGSSEEYKTKTGNYVKYAEYDELASRNMYGASKISIEIIGKEYVRQYNSNIYFTRSFNHSGPGQDLSYVLSDFAKQCAEIQLGKKDPVIEVGNIEVARDFLDVRDVIKAYCVILKKGIPGEIYNVCSGKAYVIKELLNILIELTGENDIEIKVDPLRLRKLDPQVVFGDNSKILLHTHWEPKIPIKRTLEDVYDYWIKTLES